MIDEKKPLYCFKIDEKNAVLTRYEINNYHEKMIRGVPKIFYTANLGCKDACEHDFSKYNLDKVNNMRIHSFNPDMDEALAIVNGELIARREEAYNNYNRWNELIIHLNKNMG